VDIIFILILLVLLLRPRGEITKQPTEVTTPSKKACPPHKWNYALIEGEEGEHLKCDICHKRPGELQ